MSVEEPQVGDVVTFEWDGEYHKGVCLNIDPEEVDGECYQIVCPDEIEQGFWWVNIDEMTKVERRNVDVLSILFSYVEDTLPVGLVKKE